jgi:hypothetical protein
MKIKPMDIEVFETEYSIYEIMTSPVPTYRRSAKVEQEVDSHRLVYGEWLPLASYDIIEIRGERCLHIMAPDSVHGILTSALVEDPAEMGLTS